MCVCTAAPYAPNIVSVLPLCCCTRVRQSLVTVSLHLFAAEFFEECIEEERYAAEKLTIMREAIHAQPQYKKSAGKFVEGSDVPASPEPVEDAAPLNGQGSDVPASAEPVKDAAPLNGQGSDVPASAEPVKDAAPLNGH